MDMNAAAGDENLNGVDDDMERKMGGPTEETQEEAEKREALGRVNAYASLSVISGLMFGFAVTVIFEFATDDILTNWITEYSFSILMSIVMVCNAYAMIVMTFNYYVVYRFIAEHKTRAALIFMRKASKFRKSARIMFRWGMALFLIATAIYLTERIDTVAAIICAVILVSGTIVIMLVLHFMMDLQPAQIAKNIAKENIEYEKEKRIEEANDTATNEQANQAVQ